MAAALRQQIVEALEGVLKEERPEGQRELLEEMRHQVREGRAAGVSELLQAKAPFAHAWTREQGVDHALVELLTLERSRELPVGLRAARTPSELMELVTRRPSVLREALLEGREGDTSPRESLYLNLERLAFTLDDWFQAPALQKGAPFRGTYEALRGLCLNSCVILESLANESAAQGCLCLLRWRLERCEDPLALPEGWRLEHKFFWGSVVMEATFDLLQALQRELLTDQGSLLSPGTWGALLPQVLTVPNHAYVSISQQRREMEVLEGVRRLQERAPQVAAELVALEEDLRELPPPAREIFLEKLLLRHAPLLTPPEP